MKSVKDQLFDDVKSSSLTQEAMSKIVGGQTTTTTDPYYSAGAGPTGYDISSEKHPTTYGDTAATNRASDDPTR